MAIQDPTLPVSGNPISSAAFGIKVANTIKELIKYTAAGQVLYSTSPTTLAAVSPVANALLGWNADGTALEAKTAVTVITNRQGGDATNWSVAGTTNYAVSSQKIQMGVLPVSVTNGWSYNHTPVTLTFPAAFSAIPNVIAYAVDTSVSAGAIAPLMVDVRNVSSSSCDVTVVLNTLASGNQACEVHWFAVCDS